MSIIYFITHNYVFATYISIYSLILEEMKKGRKNEFQAVLKFFFSEKYKTSKALSLILFIHISEEYIFNILKPNYKRN